MLKKLLNFTLKPRESKAYMKWLAERDGSREGHHIIKKRNDFLIAKITSEQHKKVHYATPDALDFETLLVNAMENLMDYTEYLEKKIK